MKNFLSPKLLILATLLTGSISMADLSPKLQTAEQTDKVMKELINSLLSKMGEVRELKFNFKINTAKTGLPLEEGAVSLVVPLTGQVSTEIITSKGKPNLFIGNNGVRIHLNGELAEDAGKTVIVGAVKFKNGSSSSNSTLPTDFKVGQMPILRVGLSSLNVQFDLPDGSTTGVPLLGKEISGSCKAGIWSTINGKQIWQDLDVCNFAATYNTATKRYDITGQFTSNGN